MIDFFKKKKLFHKLLFVMPVLNNFIVKIRLLQGRPTFCFRGVHPFIVFDFMKPVFPYIIKNKEVKIILYIILFLFYLFSRGSLIS